MAGEELYDQMGSDYEMMVSWERRISNETPFFKELFAQRSVNRVADVACGVGRHAVAFASWGLEVAGADPSGELLRLARANAQAAGVEVAFIQTDFLNLAAELGGGFDAVVCIGNSLQHLLDPGEVVRGLQQMNLLMAPGGTLVAQNRSAERMFARGDHVMMPRLVSLPGRDMIFVRMVEVGVAMTTLNVIRLTKHDGHWETNVKSTPLRPIPKAEMEESLARAGFTDLEFYGDYQKTPFAGEKSEDLLVVARKTGAERAQ